MKALRAFGLWVIFATMAIAQAAPHGIFPTHKQRLKNALAELLKVPTPGRASTMHYYGGPVISNVKVYSVFWGANVNSDVKGKIGDFFAASTNSTYLDWLKEYNTNITAMDGRQGTNQSIGRGTYAGAFTIQPKNASASLQDADVQAELDAQIAVGALPRPDDNTIYFIYFPAGINITIDGSTSCEAFCAYHEGFVSKSFGNVYYGIMPDIGGFCQQGCGFSSGLFNSMTEITSHELMEAITDPFPTPGDKPAYPQAWNSTDGQEIGDVCVAMGTSLTTPSGSYALQQEWSNSANGCAKGPYKNP